MDHQAESDTIRFIETAEYRRLVYRMYRKEGVRWKGGPLYRLPAYIVWQMVHEYVEAIR